MEIARTAYYRSECEYDIQFGDATFRWRPSAADIEITHNGDRGDLNDSSGSRYSYSVRLTLSDMAKAIETIDLNIPPEKIAEQLGPVLTPMIRLVAKIAGIPLG